MPAHTLRMSLKSVLLLIGMLVFSSVTVAAHAPENFMVVDGVAIYLGVMPAQILQGYNKELVEGNMHGGVPYAGHRDHVVVALFDQATGKRIENAKVTSRVMELGRVGEKKNLDAMEIAGTVTYGNYFDMPNNDIYHIKIWISFLNKPGVIEAQFTHQHFDG